MTRYILGNGLNALIFAFYNPGYTILSLPDNDTDYNEDFDTIVAIPDCKENITLLEDLNIPYKKTYHSLIYIKDGKKVPPTLKVKRYYIKKKLTDCISGETLQYDASISAKIDVKINQEYKNKISLLNTKPSIIAKHLKSNLNPRIRYLKITKIDKTHLHHPKGKIPYTHLVSTIPAPDFYRLWGEKKEFKTIPTKFARVPTTKKKREIKEFVGEEKYVRTVQENYKAYYEFVGDIPNNHIKKILPSTEKIIDIPIGKIGFEFIFPPVPNITFLGRNAEWNPDCWIKTVVAKSREYGILNRIWEEQARFNSNFLDFNKLNTLKQRQKFTKEYILHINSEINELLESINWKFYQKEKDLDFDNITEELIDVFKYLLSIALIWNIRPVDFVEQFIKKSNACIKRYEKGGFNEK